MNIINRTRTIKKFLWTPKTLRYGNKDGKFQRRWLEFSEIIQGVNLDYNNHPWYCDYYWKDDIK